MPREIDCPECDHSLSKDQQDDILMDKDCQSGLYCETTCEDCEHIHAKPEPCKTCRDTGKIKVFTQTELNKAVQDERNYNIVELERLLEKEANEYADMEYIQGVEDCLKALRARNK